MRKTQQGWLVKNLLHVVIFLGSLSFAGCDLYVNPESERVYQENSKNMLVAGYVNFSAPFVDSDRPVFIFQYQFPPDLTGRQVFAILRKQNKGYEVVSESKNELVLRSSVTYYGTPAFDEYRFLIDDNRNKITAMSASILIKDEGKLYRNIYLKEFYRIGFSER